MILTCENCHIRYLVASSAIGEEGRRVRCTNCGHEWFQEYERIDADFLDEEGDELDLETEPIPEGVKPIPEGSSLPARPRGDESESRSHAVMAGYGAAVLVFIVTGALLIMFRQPVIDAWPAAAGLYEMIGLAPPLPGEGLILDRITAVAAATEEGVNTLSIEGNIVNLRNELKTLPPLVSELRTAQGETYDVWKVTPPRETLGPQEEIRFRTTYPDVPGDVREVNIRFALPE